MFDAGVASNINSSAQSTSLLTPPKAVGETSVFPPAAFSPPRRFSDAADDDADFAVKTEVAIESEAVWAEVEAWIDAEVGAPYYSTASDFSLTLYVCIFTLVCCGGCRMGAHETS
jgi:hypothetical protein